MSGRIRRGATRISRFPWPYSILVLSVVGWAVIAGLVYAIGRVVTRLAG